MTTASGQLPALAHRFTLVPTVQVGPLVFGEAIAAHDGLLSRAEPPAEGEAAEPEDGYVGGLGGELEYDAYVVAGLEEALVVYADVDGRIESVSFYEFCIVDGRDLIDMGVGELMLQLGVPDEIEAETIGDEVELLYAYERLGLTVWTSDGRVCAVQASTGASD